MYLMTYNPTIHCNYERSVIYFTVLYLFIVCAVVARACCFVCVCNSEAWSWTTAEKTSYSWGTVVRDGIRRKQCRATPGIVCL